MEQMLSYLCELCLDKFVQVSKELIPKTTVLVLSVAWRSTLSYRIIAPLPRN